MNARYESDGDAADGRQDPDVSGDFSPLVIAIVVPSCRGFLCLFPFDRSRCGGVSPRASTVNSSGASYNTVKQSSFALSHFFRSHRNRHFV